MVHSRFMLYALCFTLLVSVGALGDSIYKKHNLEQFVKDTPWEKLKLPETTEPFTKNLPTGEKIKGLKFTGNVTMWQTGPKSYAAVDNSGLGAVGCVWGVYSNVRNLIKACGTSLGPDAEKTKSELMTTNELLSELESALDKIAIFISQNSLEDISIEELKVRSEKIKGLGCVSPENVDDFISPLKKKTKDQFKADVEKILSIPRPPVNEPCL